MASSFVGYQNIPADSKPAHKSGQNVYGATARNIFLGVKHAQKKGQRSFGLCTLTTLLVLKRAE